MEELQSIRNLLKRGYCVEYKNLSISRVSDYVKRPRVEYLVELSRGRKPYSKLFTNLTMAIHEFLDIKRKEYGE